MCIENISIFLRRNNFLVYEFILSLFFLSFVITSDRDYLFLFFFLMKYTFLLPVIVAFGVVVSQVHAADVVVNGVNLGSCKNYTDGCNDCSVGDNGVAACTKRMCIQAGTPKCLDVAASTDDTQLTDIDKTKQDTAVKTLQTDFKLKTFNSCDNMESVMKNFIKDYYSAHPYGGGYYRGGPLMMEDAIVDKQSLGTVPSANSSDSAK